VLPCTSCAWAEKTVAEATVNAMSEDNKAFILRAQSNKKLMKINAGLYLVRLLNPDISEAF
jgi:hypothetical protein